MTTDKKNTVGITTLLHRDTKLYIKMPREIHE